MTQEMSETEWIKGAPGKMAWWKVLVTVNGQPEPSVRWWADAWYTWPGGSIDKGIEITHYAPIGYDPPPAPEKPLVQRVHERLGIEQPYNRTWADVADGTSFGSQEARDALAWRIETELLKRHPAVLEEEEGKAPEEWAMTYRIHYGLSGTFCGHTRLDALLKTAIWLMEEVGA